MDVDNIYQNTGLNLSLDESMESRLLDISADSLNVVDPLVGGDSLSGLNPVVGGDSLSGLDVSFDRDSINEEESSHQSR